MLDNWLDNRAQRRFNNKLTSNGQRRDASSGVSVVEIALVLPMLLMILGGVVVPATESTMQRIPVASEPECSWKHPTAMWISAALP